jgi:glycosyltransferase involved in cell wall biosynthesis
MIRPPCDTKPAATGLDLAVIIPAYNEGNRIGPTLHAVLAFLAAQPLAAEIVVVDDGSLDDTAAVVARYQGGTVPLRLISYQPNRGKGHAVRTGTLAASGRLVLHLDADYSVGLEEFAKLHRAVGEGADIAIGSRAIAGACLLQRQVRWREWAGRAFGWLQRAVLGLPYHDTQCGFKLFTAGAAARLFPQQRLDGVVYDGEILFLARRAHLRVVEVPIVWRHDPDSRLRYGWAASVAVWRDLWRVRRLHRRDPEPTVDR